MRVAEPITNQSQIRFQPRLPLPAASVSDPSLLARCSHARVGVRGARLHCIPGAATVLDAGRSARRHVSDGTVIRLKASYSMIGSAPDTSTGKATMSKRRTARRFRGEATCTKRAVRAEALPHHTHMQQVAAVNWSTGEGG